MHNILLFNLFIISNVVNHNKFLVWRVVCIDILRLNTD